MSGKDDVALEIKNVSKSFHLPTEQASGVKQAFINWTKGIKGYKRQQVLSDISFEVKKGDFFGIVGCNGSGKSTLLKVISGIYTADSGSVEVYGKLVPFIELGVGFNPELTGRDNIYMNGAMLGFSNTEVDAMYSEIVNFAELPEFMDQKLKNYSSGMQVRLAFSIAIKAQGDILVLDEVLAVGDEAFQRKCFNYFAQLKKEKKTVILVTHSMSSVQQFCNKAMLIDKGHGSFEGSPADIAQAYRELNGEVDVKNITKIENKKIKIDSNFVNKGHELLFNIKFFPKERIIDPVISFIIYKDTGEWIYRWVSDEKIKDKIDFSKDNNLKIELENIFPNGVFYTLISIKSRDRSVQYADFKDPIEFEIINGGSHSADVFWKPKEKVALK